MQVIVGANGYLGSYIVKNILEKTTDNIIATCRDAENAFTDDPRVKWVSCDIENEKDRLSLASLINSQQERCNVCFLAAYHHPDAVQQNPEKAYNINVAILDEILSSLTNVRCLFYPSTDSVYGNSENRHHFKENDPLRPVNIYGEQKAKAEAVVNSHGFNVVRFPFLIGASLLPHKKHFYDIIAESILSEKPFELFSDSLRSSLDFNGAAAILLSLIDNYSDEMPKILNLSGDDDLSKYDVGLMIAEKIGADKKYVVPISLSDGGEIFKTERAKSTLMDNTLVKKVLGLDEIKINL